MVGLLLIAIGVLCTFWTGAWFFAMVGIILGVSCEVAAYRENHGPRPPSDSYRSGW
jgi:hypothetical protein